MCAHARLNRARWPVAGSPISCIRRSPVLTILHENGGQTPLDASQGRVSSDRLFPAERDALTTLENLCHVDELFSFFDFEHELSSRRM